MEEKAPQWALGTIAGTLGTILLVVIAPFGLYIVGAVLTYVGIVQPGVITVFAVGYLALVVLVPLRLGRTMRAKGRSWRATLAATAAAIAAISLAFFPFAAITMTM